MSKTGKLENNDRSFDLVFWHKVGPEGRFSAAWGMLKDYCLMKGKDASQQRLQRSVQNIEWI